MDNDANDAMMMMMLMMFFARKAANGNVAVEVGVIGVGRNCFRPLPIQVAVAILKLYTSYEA